MTSVSPAGNLGGPPVRVTDFFYATAFAILLGWLVLGNVVDAEHPGGWFSDESTASNPPAVSASSRQPQPDESTASSPPADSASPPQPVALATVDERSFWIFVGGSPDLYSVAVSEDD